MQSVPQGKHVIIHPNIPRLMQELGTNSIPDLFAKAHSLHADKDDIRCPRVEGAYFVINARLGFKPKPPPYVQRAYQHQFGLMT